MDPRHCHSLEVPLLHQFLGRWDLWSVACLVVLEVRLVPSSAPSDPAVPRLVHGTPYLTLHQIAWPCLSPCQITRLICFLQLGSELYLDFGRGGMTGLLGDLRGLKEGFMVVFVASERQKMEKFELAVSRINYLCSHQRRRLFEGTPGERACPQAALAGRSVAVCATCLTWEWIHIISCLDRQMTIEMMFCGNAKTTQVRW